KPNTDTIITNNLNNITNLDQNTHPDQENTKMSENNENNTLSPDISTHHHHHQHQQNQQQPCSRTNTAVLLVSLYSALFQIPLISHHLPAASPSTPNPLSQYNESNTQYN